MTRSVQFQVIDLRGRLSSTLPLQFLRAEIPTGGYSSPFAVIRYSEYGKEQNTGLRLDLDKGVFLDHFDDVEKEAFLRASVGHVLATIHESMDAGRLELVEPSKVLDKKPQKRQRRQKTAIGFNVTERRAGDVTILDLQGRLVSESNIALRDSVRSLTEAGKQKIMINLAGVDYIDSMGIGELIANYTLVHRQGGQLKLLNLTNKLQNLLVITKLLTVFDSYDNEAEALQSFK